MRASSSNEHAFTADQRVNAGWLPLVAILAVFQLGFVFWLLVEPGGERAVVYVDDISLTVAAAVAAVAASAASVRYLPGKMGLAWGMVALGLWMATLGEAAWGFQELALGREVPFPSVADVGYLGLYPPVFLGLLLMPQAPLSALRRVRLVLDVLIVTGAAALISWYLIIAELTAGSEASDLADGIGVAYPVADLAVAFAVVLLLFRGERTVSAVSLALLGLGFLSIAVTDSFYTYATQVGNYASGSYIDIGWMAGYNLVAVSGALSAGRRVNLDQAHRDESHASGMWPSVAAYLPLVPLAAIVLIDHDHAERGMALVAGMMAMVLLALVRQLVTIGENYQLNRQLADLAGELRSRIQSQAMALLRKSDEVRRGEELFATAFHASPAPFAITRISDGKLIDVNDALLRLLEFERQEVTGSTSAALEIWANEADRERLAAALGQGGTAQGLEATLRTKRGKLVEVVVSGTLVEVNGEACVFTIGLDVTARRKAEETVRRLAYHDSLTGLPNRELFKDRLGVALRQARRKNGQLAVIFLDLDEFKDVNDTAGHAEGDKLLRFVASGLSKLIREADTLARLGGDEFTILLPEVSGAEEASVVTERVLSALRRPWLVDDHEFRVTGSAGVTIYPADGEDPETLLRNADTAMYRAKNAGKDTYQLYTPSMNAQIRERLALESELRRALEREEFVIHYQPLVEIPSGVVVGAEALLRWNSPRRGLVAPGDFIPAAEASGLIVPIGEWVLRTACGDASAWNARPEEWNDGALGPLRVSVNLSARQFDQTDLIGTVERALQESGLDPRRLELEITEGIAVSDVEFTVSSLSKLRTMGIEIAIDDFGTGHSSLTYLKRFPVDALKIDRSFIRDVMNDPTNGELVRAIISIGHTLGLKVIAEGVETAEQLRFLSEPEARPRQQVADLRCDEFQGFLYSKPVPLEEFLKVAAASRQGATPGVEVKTEA